VKLDWQIMFVTGHPFGNFMPFFINWLESPHPADSTPKGCVLDGCVVQLIENAAVFGQLMNALGVEVEVLEGPEGMRAVVDSPNGRVMLH
jgi:hypothetical protein